MNTKSEDVVKNVESNNVESTSNEQRQTNKPIVISRRRLLKAGVAGIPVVLTMAGIAPAAGIQTVSSAASGLMYGGNKVYNRFAGDDSIENNGLVRTDHNGFVLLKAGGVKSSPLTVSTDPSTDGNITITLPATSYIGSGTVPDTMPSKTFTFSIDPPSGLTVNAYLHKTGVWYTDRIVTGTSKDLLTYIRNLSVTVKVGESSITSTKTAENTTFTSTGSDWYKTPVPGWSIKDGYDNIPQDYYRLPTDSTSEIDSVNFNAKVSFTYTDGDYTYEYNNQVVQIPLKLNVSGIPAQINPGGI